MSMLMPFFSKISAMLRAMTTSVFSSNNWVDRYKDLSKAVASMMLMMRSGLLSRQKRLVTFSSSVYGESE